MGVSYERGTPVGPRGRNIADALVLAHEAFCSLLKSRIDQIEIDDDIFNQIPNTILMRCWRAHAESEL